MIDFPNNPNNNDSFIDDNKNLWIFEVDIWVLKTGEVRELSQLGDVNITSLQTGDGIVYNSTSGNFYNQQIPVPTGTDENKNYPSTRYFFKARNSSKTFIDSTTDIMKFDKIVFDPNNVFNISTYQFTAPVSGYYKIGVNIYHIVAINETYVYIYINNTLNRLLVGNSGNSIILPVIFCSTAFMKLNQNDTVDIRLNTTGTYNGGNGNHQLRIPRHTETEFYGYLYRKA